MERMAGMSPRLKARIAGIFEALEGAASAGGQVVILNKLVVSANAAATAANILGQQPLFMFGFAVSLLGVAFHVVWTLLFYDLFRPVNRSLALLAAFFGIVTCAMQALTAFFYISPLLILQSGGSSSAFSATQLQALALLLLKLNGQAFNIDLVFFGFWCIVSGYLIARSTFLPRILGVLLMIDGLGWALYVSPPLATQLFALIATASAVAELPLQFWLIVFGVNSQRWQAQAGAAGQQL